MSFKYMNMFLVSIIIYIINVKCCNNIYENFHISSDYTDNTLCIEPDLVTPSVPISQIATECGHCNNVDLIRSSLIFNNNGEVDIDIIEDISNEQRNCLNNLENISMYNGYSGIHIYINNKIADHITIITKVNLLLVFMLKDILDIYKNKLGILNIYIYKCDPTYVTGYGVADTRDSRYNYITDYITSKLLLLTPSDEGLSPNLYNQFESYDNIVMGVGGPETYPLLTICESDLNQDANYVDNKEQTFIHELLHLYYTNVVKIINPAIHVRLTAIYLNVVKTTCDPGDDIYLCRNVDEFIAMMTLIWFSATPLSQLYRDLDDENYTVNIFHKSWKNKYFDSNINTIDDIRNINGLEELLIDIFGGSYISNNYCNNVNSSVTKSFICDPCNLYTDQVDRLSIFRRDNTYYTYNECIGSH